MATTPEQDEYLKAFNADQQQTEDVGTNITNQDEDANPSESAAADVEGGPTPADAVVLGNGAAEAVGQSPDDGGVVAEAAQEGEPVAEEQAEKAEPGGDTDDGELSPEDLQRQKSWEGRLNKRESDLSAREAALTAPQEVSDADVAEIQRQLSEDFGPDFVQMILKLAAYEAKKMAGTTAQSGIEPLAKQVNEAISAVTEAFQSQHFAAISEAHEDFSEVVNSPEFEQWVNAQSEEAKPAILKVIESGTPAQVIRMLNDYKTSLEKNDDPWSDAEDAASGMRSSSPVSLPQRAPVAGNDEYKNAWDQM